MSDEDELDRLIAKAREGELDRRAFVGKAIALGLTVAAAEALAVGPAQAAPRTAPNAKPDVALRSRWGKTPKVLTEWAFMVEAKGLRIAPKSVRWSGTGKFTTLPSETGPAARVLFDKPGKNTVTVSFRTASGQKFRRSISVVAKDANLYARVGATANVQADAHGCPACPHICTGPTVVGHPEAKVGGRPLLFVGATGKHSTCCGPNTFEILEGDPEILLDGKAVPRQGDKTQHCGGQGKLVTVAPE